MKRKLSIAGVFLLLLFLLRYPQEALSASREGMKLWLNTLLPTLLPFLILTGFLIHTDGIEKILSPFSVMWKTVLGLSPAGAYVFLLGMLCGYPMGAKLASELFACQKIDRREAEYLLTFTNQASPAFLTTYLAHICLEQRTSAKEILIVIFTANILCMIFFRFVIFRNNTATRSNEIIPKKETSTTSSPGSIIDVSIMNGFETITRLGGYILLFSIISACIRHYWKWSPSICSLIVGTMEITTGLHQIALSGIPYEIRYPISMALTAFGGFCILAQTRSVTDKRLSFLPYISAKCMNGAVTAILLLILSKVI
ncbi:MAG: hypothetical protein Q4C77_00165 [Eubacteriales bacterium]|nr:hypothetical protein [Eubacteriales bacterium]